MSELVNKHDNRATIRWKLLASASAAILIASGFAASAADADRPSVWLRLGWHYEDAGELGSVFVPPFEQALKIAGFHSPSGIQRRMGYDYGGEAGLLFAPDGSDWSFTASARYGRAHGRGTLHQETSPASSKGYSSFSRSGVQLFHFTQVVAPVAKRFEDAEASSSESHTILDFRAGKDVGLGVGAQSRSRLEFGVRFAQFRSRSGVNISADPDFQFVVHHTEIPLYGGVFHRTQLTQYFHQDSIIGTAQRSFKGLGPSISWNASAALAGNIEDGELDLDWGLNASVLFGPQRTQIQHKTSSKLFDAANLFGTPGVYATHGPTSRSKRVTVPNVGGFAGVSYRFTDAELKLGYRADFFFNAMDGGIDTRQSTTPRFLGPFASISIGLGGSD